MKRDFSDNAYNELVGLVKEVEDEQWCDFTDWLGDRWYDFESWIGLLSIDEYIDDVNSYHKKVIDKNNASVEDIKRIFDNVKIIDQNYSTRTAAYLTRLNEFKMLVGKFAETISPENGTFHPKELGDLIEGYKELEKYLKILGTDGLSEKDIEEMDELMLSKILEKFTSSIIDSLPDINVGEEITIPIGPGVSVYYSVSSTIQGNSDFDLNLAIKNQKMKFSNISLGKGIDGKIKMEVKGDTRGKISISATYNNDSVSLGMDGVEISKSLNVGNNTYTLKMKENVNKIFVEEAIKTNYKEGAITSKLGITKENNNWTQLPQVETVDDTIELPSLKIPDLDWEDVATGVAVVVVAGGAIILAPETGGTSLTALLAL